MQDILEITRKVEIDNLSVSFKDFLIRDKFNKFLLNACLCAIVLQFVIFKYYYPFAAFINGDSYEYLESAFYNLSINIYPIGYPKFLRLFSVFLSNDFSLVAFQYAFAQVSVVFFIFTIFYFLNVEKWLRTVIALLSILNPVMLYISNYVSSDSLFFSLSVCWFTLIIWVLHRPSLTLIIVHSVVVFFAFSVRYNAMFYPVVSLVALAMSVCRMRDKFVGVGVLFLLIGGFAVYTAYSYKKVTGKFQFSPFSGWQIANNAVYAYKFVEPSNRMEPAEKFKGLEVEVRRYFDSVENKNSPFQALTPHTLYMWAPNSPLRVYMNDSSRKDAEKSEFLKWARIAPLYKDYGTDLIKRYPATFAKRYLWQNLIKYYAPPIEFLETYGFNVDTVPPIAKRWFGYETNRLFRRVEGKNVNILNYYPTFFATVNAMFLMLGISFLLLDGKVEKKIYKTWILFVVFWVANLVFSVLASPIALRFQLFALLLCIAYDFILLDFVLRRAGFIKAK